MQFRHLMVVFLLACTCRSVHADDQADLATLVADGQAEVSVIYDGAEKLNERTGETIASYLADHSGVTPKRVLASDWDGGFPTQTLVVIDSSPQLTLLAKVGVELDVPADRDDAYALKVVRQPDGWVIAVAGRTPAGAKYAAYQLMEQMRIEDRSARVAAMDVTASPFFATRSVSLFNIWRVPVEVIRRCNLEAWPTEKVVENVDTYDAFGFNAIETHDRFHEGFLQAVYGISRQEWREKVHAMADRAHEKEMTVFLRLWGNSVALPVKKIEGGYTPFGFDNLSPDIPEEKARWDKEIRDYASRSYASHIDHLIGHWADAGGVSPGSKATVKDSMLLHNELVAAFRKINPKMQSSFNLWGMEDPRGKRGWPGYEDHLSIASAGILPKDVAIAQTTRSLSHRYSEQVTADILAAGYPAAVWTWRRADTEVRFGDTGLRIRLHRLIGDYFKNLPDSARQLAWHNIERNHHGISNDINYYVAGKLMWDPRANVDELVGKYCQLVFGQGNAAAMAEAFNTVEAARHIELFVSDEFVKEPQAAAKRARAALDGVKAIKLPAEHKSRLPSVVSAQDMQTELQLALEVISDNATIMAEQLPAIEALVESGQRDQANAQIDALMVKAQKWLDSVDGGVEGYWLKQRLTEMRSGASEKTDQGFLTRNAQVFDVAEDSSSIRLGSQPGKLAVALQELKPAEAGVVEFKFHFRPTRATGSRNGGLVFGPDKFSETLTRCQVMLGGSFIRISGKGVDPVRREVESLDPAAEHECVVRINPQRKTITFTVNGHSVEAAIEGNVPPIRYYGYVTEQAESSFSEILITH